MARHSLRWRGKNNPASGASHLRDALKAYGLPALSWYQSTRHTFASLFVLGGGSIEMLRTIMGHSSVTTTERYSHLRADLFGPRAFEVIAVDLSKPAGAVVPLTSSQQNLTPPTASETHEVLAFQG